MITCKICYFYDELCHTFDDNVALPHQQKNKEKIKLFFWISTEWIWIFICPNHFKIVKTLKNLLKKNYKKIIKID